MCDDVDDNDLFLDIVAFSSTSQNVKITKHIERIIRLRYAMLCNEIDYNNINKFFFIYMNIFLLDVHVIIIVFFSKNDKIVEECGNKKIINELMINFHVI